MKGVIITLILIYLNFIPILLTNECPYVNNTGACIKKRINLLRQVYTIEFESKKKLNKLLSQTDVEFYMKFDEESYVVKKCIGYGGQGPVFLAEYEGKEYAIKIVEEMKEKSGKALDRIIKYQSKHPDSSKYIMRVYKKESDDDGLVYYLMEYVQGRELSEYSRNDKLPRLDIVKIIRSLVQAVKELHDEYGIAHRDIKLHNILVRNDTKDIVLIDLDMGVLIEEHKVLTNAGTQDYQAPEVFFLGKSYAENWFKIRQSDNAYIKQEYYNVGVVIYVYAFKRFPYYKDIKDLEQDPEEKNDTRLRSFYKKLLANQENIDIQQYLLIDPVKEELEMLPESEKIKIFLLNALKLKPMNRELGFD